MRFTPVFIFAIILSISHTSDDLYSILGVSKRANKKEIKAAYKKQAMEWHPDRNDDPNANEHFMKINEAYETLSDPERREQYDRFGKTSSSGDQQPGRGGGFGGDPFQSFFGRGSPFGGFRFDFGAGGGINDDIIDKLGINNNMYVNKILPESNKKPYLLYVYADFCMRCMHVDRIFDKVANDMDNIGMGVGTVHANIHRSLAYKLKIDSVPTIIAIVENRLRYMRGELSVNNIRDFVRSVIPAGSIQQVADANYKEFLSGWKDNKVRMLFCDSKPEPSLRYLLPVFANKHRYVAGFVNTKDASTQQLRAKFRIHQNTETLMIFNEEIDHPAAQVGMKVLPRSTIDELMESNKHLLLPRLSSQELLNELCPAYTSVKRKSLCVVLLTQNTPTHDPYRDALRVYAQRHAGESDRVKYTYIYRETQGHFVDKMTGGESVSNDTSGALKMAVMWRKDPELIHYDWLPEGWFAEGPEVDNAHARLALLVADWLGSKTTPPLAITLSFDLFNEHGYPLWYRMYLRLCDWYYIALDKLYGMDEVAVVMVGTTIICMGLIWSMLRNMLDFGDEPPNPRQRNRRQAQQASPSVRPTQAQARPTINITPLVAHNFEELVLKQEPGVRVLVLFVDDSTKMKLINHFAISVKPFARSKAFKFAFLQLEDYLPWFKRLLEETIDGTTRDLSGINMRNCLGTVLALNGPRKSYSIYHAHTEQIKQKNLRQERREMDGLAGALGFDDDVSDVEVNEADLDNEAHLYSVYAQAQRLFESDLLFGLGLWLERLCEGTIKKFKIEKWPKM